MSITHPLRIFRAENKLSLQSVAKALGYSMATISRIETGHRRCTAEMAIAIETLTKGLVSRAQLRPDLWAQ